MVGHSFFRHQLIIADAVLFIVDGFRDHGGAGNVSPATDAVAGDAVASHDISEHNAGILNPMECVIGDRIAQRFST